MVTDGGLLSAAMVVNVSSKPATKVKTVFIFLHFMVNGQSLPGIAQTGFIYFPGIVFKSVCSSGLGHC
jgi:hypothetical protein